MVLNAKQKEPYTALETSFISLYIKWELLTHIYERYNNSLTSDNAKCHFEKSVLWFSERHQKLTVIFNCPHAWMWRGNRIPQHMRGGKGWGIVCKTTEGWEHGMVTVRQHHWTTPSIKKLKQSRGVLQIDNHFLSLFLSCLAWAFHLQEKVQEQLFHHRPYNRVINQW